MRRTKELTNLLALLFALLVAQAQAPKKMGFQAVIRDADNRLLCSRNVAIRVEILKGKGNNDTIIYSERHLVVTNPQGLATITIGEGTANIGDFATIDWGQGPYFIETSIDPNGGINYILQSTQEIMSVPYALYAEKAGNSFSGDYNDLTNQPAIADSIRKILQERQKDSLDNRITIAHIEEIAPNHIIISGEEKWSQAPCFQKGFCYSTLGPPDITDDKVVCEESSGKYRCKISDLPSGITYHVRAYGITPLGVIYSADTTVTTALLPNLCQQRIVKDYENNTYNTVQIGSQCWMRENLRSTRYSDGTPVMSATNRNAVYRPSENVDESELAHFGLLYTSDAILNGEASSTKTPSGVQGICPQGWHLPSCAEWNILRTNAQNNVDKVDFDATYVGYHEIAFQTGATCIYCNFGTEGLLATSEKRVKTSGKEYHVFISISQKNKTLSEDECNKTRSISVRCLQD